MNGEFLKSYINKERIYQLFSDLVAIDSVSFQERQAADFVKEYLRPYGGEIYEDQAWQSEYEIITDSDGRKKARPLQGEGKILADQLSGNVYAFIPGELPGKPLLFSAHLDTVPPGYGKKTVIDENNIIRSVGETVLGSDDFAGVTQILEALRILRENNIPHRDLELIFPVAEEIYGRGSRGLDYGRIRSEEAYVLDLSGTIGLAVLKAPSIISFQVTVKGRSAHAGFAPEEGIHAIQIAAVAVSEIKMGRIGENSTRNIGMIHGGRAGNIIPDTVVISGEIRSYSHEQALLLLEEVKEVFRQKTQQLGGEALIRSEVQIKAYQTDPKSDVVKKFQEACIDSDLPVQLLNTFGGSDNNHFVEHGINGIVISCGMQNVHTTEEFITLEDLCKGTELVVRLMMKREASGTK